MKSIAFFFLLLGFALTLDANEDFLFGSSGNPGFLVPFRIDPITGALTGGVQQSHTTMVNDFVVDPFGRFVYSCSVFDGAVVGYSIGPSGALTFVQMVPYAAVPNDLSIDPFGRFLFVGGQSAVSSYKIDQTTGALALSNSLPVEFGTGVNTEVDRTGRFLYNITYFPQSLNLYSVNQITGELTFSSSTALQGISGQFFVGQLLAHPTLDFIYSLINPRFSSVFPTTVAIYSINPDDGSPGFLGTLEFDYLSRLSINHSGKYLFTADPVNNLVSAYIIDQGTGALFLNSSVKLSAEATSVEPSGRFLYATAATLRQVGINTLNGTFNGPRVASSMPPVSDIASIRIPELLLPSSGPAPVYPSTRTISGFAGSISKVRVRLTNLTHTSPDDLDILLVGPEGQNVMLMSDAGGDAHMKHVTLDFDDAAPSLPDSDGFTSGTYSPTDYDSADSELPPPAPEGAHGTALSTFAGTNPNGTWSLFVNDDTAAEQGIIESWGLSLDLLADDFEDTINSWSTQKGSCVEENGKLTCSPGALVFAPAPWMSSGLSSCTNCTVEADIAFASASSSMVALEGWFTDRKNRVEVLFKPDRNKIILKQKAGGSTVVKQKTPINFVPGMNYRVKVAFDGTNFHLFVNETLAFIIPAVETPSGNFGFKVKNTVASFDNIRVSLEAN